MHNKKATARYSVSLPRSTTPIVPVLVLSPAPAGRSSSSTVFGVDSSTRTTICSPAPNRINVLKNGRRDPIPLASRKRRGHDRNNEICRSGTQRRSQRNRLNSLNTCANPLPARQRGTSNRLHVSPARSPQRPTAREKRNRAFLGKRPGRGFSERSRRGLASRCQVAGRCRSSRLQPESRLYRA